MSDMHMQALVADKTCGCCYSGRLDDDKTWSYKAGDTLTRNTYRNGTPISDVEQALGAYTDFCGYYEVGGRI